MGAPAGSYPVRDIEGLDPVDATLTTSTLASVDGAQPQNAQRGTRNITMKLGLEPDWSSQTVQSLRKALYSWFSPKQNISLAFYFDNLIAAVIAGQVETCNAGIFVQDPEMDISILCYQPDFMAPQAVLFDSNTRNDQFPEAIQYDGTTDCGVVFTLGVISDLTEFVLSNTTPENQLQRMTIDGQFQAGDTITINTIPGQRAITLTRNNLSSSLMAGLDLSSIWIMLTQGNNLFRATDDVGGQPYTMNYTPLYGAL
jgi:hypothetical protein